MDAQMLIHALTDSVDRLWTSFGEPGMLDDLVYAKDEYGVMQQVELNEIMALLVHLRQRTSDLSADCGDIPNDMRNTVQA